MDGLYLLTLAVGLGLPGFVEPCSIGANMVFLGHLREKDRGKRLRETATFALVRSAVLGLFGRIPLGRLLPERGGRSLGLGLLFGFNLPACLPVDAGPPGVRSPVGLRHAVRLRARTVFTPRSPGLLRAAKLVGHLSRLGGATPYVIGAVFLLLAVCVLYTATPHFGVGGS